MPETASGERRPMDEADVQAIIDRLGGVEVLAGGERGVPRGCHAHESEREEVVGAFVHLLNC